MEFSERGYSSRRAGFPQETTINRFFDEAQFDAHCRLGCELAQRMIEESDLERLIIELDATDR